MPWPQSQREASTNLFHGPGLVVTMIILVIILVPLTLLEHNHDNFWITSAKAGQAAVPGCPSQKGRFSVAFKMSSDLIPQWFIDLGPVLQAFVATLFTWLVTALGAAMVFFFKKRLTASNLRAGGIRQGGSTITQQMAKTFVGWERTYLRKFKEAVVALRMEKKYSKEQILHLYLIRLQSSQTFLNH